MDFQHFISPRKRFSGTDFRNMSTTTIFANLDKSSGTNFGGIAPYPNFNLEKLANLPVWPSKQGEPSDLLRAISTCKTLNSFTTINAWDFKPIVDTLAKFPLPTYLKSRYATQ